MQLCTRENAVLFLLFLFSFPEYSVQAYFRIKISFLYHIRSFSHHFSPPNHCTAMCLNTSIRIGIWIFLSSGLVLWSNTECNPKLVTLPSHASIVKLKDLLQLRFFVLFLSSSGKCLQQMQSSQIQLQIS